MAVNAIDFVLGQNIGGNHDCFAFLAHAEESAVNGIWYEILRHYFPFPQFIIAPETYNKKGRRIDLCVLQNTNNGPRPVFSYEGKHGGTPTEFWLDLHQAGQYLPTMTRMHNGRHYGMLAAGQHAIILEYAQGGQALLQVTGPNLATNHDHNTNSWDVRAHEQSFDKILTAIRTEINTTP